MLQLDRRHAWPAEVGRTARALRADGDDRVRRLLDRLDALVAVSR